MMKLMMLLLHLQFHDAMMMLVMMMEVYAHIRGDMCVYLCRDCVSNQSRRAGRPPSDPFDPPSPRAVRP
jgi:hypothetical protein